MCAIHYSTSAFYMLALYKWQCYHRPLHNSECNKVSYMGGGGGDGGGGGGGELDTLHPTLLTTSVR